MIRLGLTGSIGMGKSTTAAMFAARGVPVYSADAAVHDLYAGPLVSEIEAAFPGVTGIGGVDRARLSAAVLNNPDALKRLEAIVHPAVRKAEAAFLAEAEAKGAPLVLLDIPLLYETGRESDVHKVLVVTCAADLQRQRVLARPGMTAEKLAAILARQMPDADKRKRADFVIETDHGLAPVEQAVAALIRQLTSPVDAQH